jgi:hypothetical protein
MNMLSKYVQPDSELLDQLHVAIRQHAPLPDATLATYWAKGSNWMCLSGLLRSLNYRPARIQFSHHTSSHSPFFQAYANVVNSGLAIIHMGNEDPDIEIVEFGGMDNYDRACELAKKGIAVMLQVIKEDRAIFKSEPNIFPFWGDQFSSFEIERHLRDMLFCIRERLYCGPPRK